MYTVALSYGLWQYYGLAIDVKGTAVIAHMSVRKEDHVLILKSDERYKRQFNQCRDRVFLTAQANGHRKIHLLHIDFNGKQKLYTNTGDNVIEHFTRWLILIAAETPKTIHICILKSPWMEHRLIPLLSATLCSTSSWIKWCRTMCSSNYWRLQCR